MTRAGATGADRAPMGDEGQGDDGSARSSRAYESGILPSIDNLSFKSISLAPLMGCIHCRFRKPKFR